MIRKIRNVKYLCFGLEYLKKILFLSHPIVFKTFGLPQKLHLNIFDDLNRENVYIDYYCYPPTTSRIVQKKNSGFKNNFKVSLLLN